MPGEGIGQILTVNTGSSSLKVALYGSDLQRVLSAKVERIGSEQGHVHVTSADGSTLLNEQQAVPNHGAALDAILRWLHGNDASLHLAGVGHRVVYGGAQFREPQVVSDEMLEALRLLEPIDPDHLPQALNAVVATRRAFPQVPQVACFDTTFHKDMPEVARTYALPRDVRQDGVIRYGFHGLSCEYVMQELFRLDPEAANGRVIIAHLGNGASMTAVRHGAGIDTTMGFTPTGGLVMGTRSGDLDPGVLLYLLRSRGLSVDALTTMVNAQSGLLGISGSTSDMRDLLERAPNNGDAELAVAVFCYTAQKFLGSLAAALGGLDVLVFTGGIGEQAPQIRERICSDLAFLSVRVDPQRNATNAAVISPDGARVTVRVCATDEDLMIARHTKRLLKEGTDHVQI